MAKKNTWKVAWYDPSFKSKAAREARRWRLFVNKSEAESWLESHPHVNVDYHGEASWSEHRIFRAALREIA